MVRCVFFRWHAMSIWDEVSTFKNRWVNVFSSLPLTPPKRFLNCLDITFHTSKQEAILPTFKNRPSANPWGCRLMDGIHAGRAAHPALHWAPEGAAVTRLAPAAGEARALAGRPGLALKDQQGQGAWLDFTFLSVEWDYPSLLHSKPSIHHTNTWGNVKAQRYLGQWSLEGTTAINKFNCTASSPQQILARHWLYFSWKSMGLPGEGAEFHFKEWQNIFPGPRLLHYCRPYLGGKKNWLQHPW